MFTDVLWIQFWSVPLFSLKSLISTSFQFHFNQYLFSGSLESVPLFSLSLISTSFKLVTVNLLFCNHPGNEHDSITTTRQKLSVVMGGGIVYIYRVPVCVHVYALSIVSRDKILRFKNTLLLLYHKRGMVRKGVLLGRVWLERLGMKDYNRKGMVGKGVTGCTGKVIAVRSIALLQSNLIPANRRQASTASLSGMSSDRILYLPLL